MQMRDVCNVPQDTLHPIPYTRHAGYQIEITISVINNNEEESKKK